MARGRRGRRKKYHQGRRPITPVESSRRYRKRKLKAPPLGPYYDRGGRISPSVEWKRKKALGGRIAGSDVASKRKRRHKKRKKTRRPQRGR